MTSKPILFISKNDTNSQILWNRLVKEGRINDFIKVCIEENPTKIPSFIKEIPSIYVKNRPVITGAAINMYLNSNNEVRNVIQVNNLQSMFQTNNNSMSELQNQFKSNLNIQNLPKQTNTIGGLGNMRPINVNTGSPVNNVNTTYNPKIEINMNAKPATQQDNKKAVVPHIETSTNGLNGINDFNAVEMSGNWSDSYSFIQDNPTPLSFCYEYLGGGGDKQQVANKPKTNSFRSRNMDVQDKYEQLQKSRML